MEKRVPVLPPLGPLGALSVGVGPALLTAGQVLGTGRLARGGLRAALNPRVGHMPGLAGRID